MGLFQNAYATYDAINKVYPAGVAFSDKAALTPLAHSTQNAHLEVTITRDGDFVSAIPVDKNTCETIIPVTEKSANRARCFYPHPLADYLEVISPLNAEKLTAYLEGLKKWVDSEYSHEKARAVYVYVSKRGILQDLEKSGYAEKDESGKYVGKIAGATMEKCFVRWRVVPSKVTATWEDLSLIESYIKYYQSADWGNPTGICMITGKEETLSEFSPKGTYKYAYNAKLVSANDDSNFTYRGRFTSDAQALTVGYEATQKAHSALKWLIANTGVTVGDRTFVCWNPEIKAQGLTNCRNMPVFSFDWTDADRFVSYRDELQDTLAGKKMALSPSDNVIVASFEAATTGRLSVTYYNDLIATDFFDRLNDWYSSLCVDYFGERSPSLSKIARCAYGTERGAMMELDDKFFAECIQQLFHSMIDKKPIPLGFVQALSNKASRLISYKTNGGQILSTACAVIRKYHNDKSQKEEYKLSLDINNKDRSYLFGRILAIADFVERSTFERGEERETNAMRMQRMFANRPLRTAEILNGKLVYYYKKLPKGLREYYRKMNDEIWENFTPGDPILEKKLKDVYLLGFYHQRAALYQKKQDNTDTTTNIAESEKGE